MTLGPLTNVAEALQADPKLIDNVQMITIMGGAVDVPGNVTGVPLSAPNRTAEFNIFVDPHAANIVFKSGAPITWCRSMRPITRRSPSTSTEP